MTRWHLEPLQQCSPEACRAPAPHPSMSARGKYDKISHAQAQADARHSNIAHKVNDGDALVHAGAYLQAVPVTTAPNKGASLLVHGSHLPPDHIKGPGDVTEVLLKCECIDVHLLWLAALALVCHQHSQAPISPACLFIPCSHPQGQRFDLSCQTSNT